MSFCLVYKQSTTGSEYTKTRFLPVKKFPSRKMNKGPRRGRAKQSSRESETISVSSIQSNHDSVGTVTEEDKVSRRKGLAKLIMFGLLVIVGFYFLLYHVISEAKRKQNGILMLGNVFVFVECLLFFSGLY